MSKTATMNVPNQPYTPEEAAEILKVSVLTLKAWRHRGTGPQFVRQGPKFVRYLQSDIDAWLNRGRVERGETNCPYLDADA
jgi:predicted DNA-binding transcriptional regulator AlpA